VCQRRHAGHVLVSGDQWRIGVGARVRRRRHRRAGAQRGAPKRRTAEGRGSAGGPAMRPASRAVLHRSRRTTASSALTTGRISRVESALRAISALAWGPTLATAWCGSAVATDPDPAPIPVPAWWAPRRRQELVLAPCLVYLSTVCKAHHRRAVSPGGADPGDVEAGVVAMAVGEGAVEALVFGCAAGVCRASS
jgi:hypothetical protein